MTRRKHPPPPADSEDYGFNVAGKGFRVSAAELLMLLGLDTITCALYMRCLRPFADRGGYVRECSYYRCLQILSCVPSPRGGRCLASPTKKQLRRAIECLVQARLIVTRWDDNRRDGALQIWVVSGVGGTSKRPVGAGVGAWSKSPESRANTH